MKTLKTIVFILGVLSIPLAGYTQSFTQGFLASAEESGTQEFFYQNSEYRYGSYVYVAGASINSNGDYDVLLSKFYGSTLVWSVTWDRGDGDDYAVDVTVDNSGRIIVVGTTYSSSSNYDGLILKYTETGSLAWSDTFNGANFMDGFSTTIVDGSDNIYVSGGTITSTESANFVTRKYNSSGSTIWTSQYDYNNLQDVGVKLVYGGGVLRVSGASQDNSSNWSIATVAYNATNGSQMSVSRISGTNNGLDEVWDVVADEDYTYIAGSVDNGNGYDWKVIKLDVDLDTVWTADYNNATNGDDKAKSIKVDIYDNVYVTGFETTSSEDKNYLTRNYSSSGVLQWSKDYDNNGGEDRGQTLEIDNSQDIIVS